MLSKKYKISLTKDIQLEGRRQKFDLFNLVIKPNKEKKPRFVVIVSGKIIKKAVARNRTRRLIYKALENLIGQIDNVDLLVIVKKDLGQLKSQEATLFLKESLVCAKVIK
jgi:ribonuclease P protein component